MARLTGRIRSEIDFDRDGKQVGFLRLPHSVHRSAYGWIPIPIACIRNGDGPRVLLMAGNHGDEYEGQIALAKLLRQLEPATVRGRIIFLSSANFPAAMAGMRTSPLDDGNLNRLFPGDPDGGPTAQIAWYIEHMLLTQCDYVFDLHSGGSSLMYLPSALSRRHADPTRMRHALELLQAFGAPISYITDAPPGDDLALPAAAARQGVMHLGTELGGGGTLTMAALRIAEDGIRRVLARIGALADEAATAPAPATRLLQVRGPEYFVYAPDSGLFEPLVELGDEVIAGQTAGIIHFHDTPWREPSLAVFQRSGIVLTKRMPCRTERGDCLFHLGTPYEEGSGP
ncbi:MAG: succinylglutamate desuccinylase/aspartoacylase family protein [Burkholderiales bacterium]|nr:succinylglutamate desuccinylase/aspartoacylase family protein [Burkholderiales bacterium]